MKRDVKINLSSNISRLDELFTTEEQRQENKLERVREIAIDELQPFRNHPFQVKNDEEMKRLYDRIREYGILLRSWQDLRMAVVMKSSADIGERQLQK